MLRVLSGALKKEWYQRMGEYLEEAPSARYEQVLKSANTGPQHRTLSKCLIQEGSDPLNVNQAVNGSVTPERFSTFVPVDEVWIINQLVFFIKDSGGFDSGGWGNSGANPLVNGVKFGLVIDGVESFFGDGGTWKSHADLGNVTYDVVYQDWGSGDPFLSVKLDFQGMGAPIRLIGEQGDKIFMDIQDDLEYLVYQHGMAQGFIENKLFN